MLLVCICVHHGSQLPIGARFEKTPFHLFFFAKVTDHISWGGTELTHNARMICCCLCPVILFFLKQFEAVTDISVGLFTGLLVLTAAHSHMVLLSLLHFSGGSPVK